MSLAEITNAALAALEAGHDQERARRRGRRAPEPRRKVPRAPRATPKYQPKSR